MSGAYRHLDVERVGDVFAVRLSNARMPPEHLEELLAEIDRFLEQSQCRKLVFSLGPEDPQCLYSVFLAKLVSLQKRLRREGGALTIAQASDEVQQIFEACRLRSFFEFVADRDAAIAGLAARPPETA